MPLNVTRARWRWRVGGTRIPLCAREIELAARNDIQSVPNYTDGFLRRPRLWGGARDVQGELERAVFDLILVAAVAQVGEPLRHDYSFHGLSGMRPVRPDLVGVERPYVFPFAVQLRRRAEQRPGRSTDVIAAGVPGAERMATRSAAGYSVAALIWIGSAFLAPPLRYAGWGAGALLEALTYGAAHRGDAAVPPDWHHFPERHGLFTIILFGELIAAIMHGIQGQESWSAGAASAAIAGVGVRIPAALLVLRRGGRRMRSGWWKTQSNAGCSRFGTVRTYPCFWGSESRASACRS